ncbi:hypothetical protein GWI33_001316 [Rhynchophorus ferrugineus]|uniref:Uncharacterized protein n=1 Tax=Rhynchophorus ferrugineus TaxID=354439 RepID=A0A834HN51_RHYFE|nr:hypothetical protein GWI33_001316 [Rhynchophorus ferrugineus]
MTNLFINQLTSCDTSLSMWVSEFRDSDSGVISSPPSRTREELSDRKPIRLGLFRRIWEKIGGRSGSLQINKYKGKKGESYDSKSYNRLSVACKKCKRKHRLQAVEID